MPYTLLPISFADGRPVPGHYFKSFDHEAHNGQGDAVFTDDPDAALRFDTRAQAIEFWQRVPKCRPTRPDGRPNRPMTCTTVEIKQIGAPRSPLRSVRPADASQ